MILPSTIILLSITKYFGAVFDAGHENAQDDCTHARWSASLTFSMECMHTFLSLLSYYYYYYYTLFLPKARCVCRQAVCKGCQILTPCWTCQIQARPKQDCYHLTSDFRKQGMMFTIGATGEVEDKAPELISAIPQHSTGCHWWRPPGWPADLAETGPPLTKHPWPAYESSRISLVRPI